jgi:uncharacterized protein
VLRLLRLALVAALTLVVMKFLVGWLEPQMTFFPFRGEQETPEHLGVAYETWRVPTVDGETVVAWWMPHEAPRAIVVYFHGNGGNLSLWLPVFGGLHARGLGVLALDYRGYGLSTGSPTEQGLYRDADALLQEVARRQPVSGDVPVIYWGRSLGGAVAAYATTVQRPDALVLESSFPDKAFVIRHNPVLRVLNVFAAYTFPTSTFLDGFDRPTLVIHGDADTIVPYAGAQRLYDAVSGPRTLVTIPRGDHNDFYGAEAREYWAAIDAFVDGLGEDGR